MATLPELTCLFAQLATSLRRSAASTTTNPTSSSSDLSDESSKAISSLVASLSSETPSSRVLDAALSLMCFRSEQVVESRIDCLVGTIVAVLSSMASCNVIRLGDGGLESIRVGSSISFGDCGELIRIGADVLENLDGHKGPSQTLLHAILRAAVSSSNLQMVLPSTSITTEDNERINAGRRAAITKLICFLPDEISVSSNAVPLRLFFWYLDPLSLKHDISEISRETTVRPFLCVKEELLAMTSWRSIVICFAISPTMFLETRALVHSWFLLTGLDSVLNLQIALISSVLDVLSRPMWWGMSMEMGLKLPFSHAYFPRKHRELLAILTGPITCENFLDLARHIGTASTSATNYSNQQNFHASCHTFGREAMSNAVDDNSTWSMLLGFPAWFYFATILIFCEEDSQDSCLLEAIFSASEGNGGNIKDLHKASVLYLSQVLNPLDENCFNLLADCTQKMSQSWRTENGAKFSKEQFPHSSGTHVKKARTLRRKLRIARVNDCEKLHLKAKDDSALALGAWLKEFDGSCVKVFSKAVTNQISTETKDADAANMQPNLLLFRIPLGILILADFLNEKGCELLLHYATTGEIIQSREMPTNMQGCVGHDLPLCFGGNGRTWPIDGACLVFNLFDILEDMSVVFFPCEDTRANFICQMKGKVSGYLLRCVRTLLELSSEYFQVGEVSERVMVDLYRRLTRWMQKGRGEGYRAFDEVANDFAKRFPIAKEN